MLNYIVGVALFVATVIAAPSTNATCIDLFWTFNSRSQSPCLVAAYLGAQCTADNTMRVSALPGIGGGPYGFTGKLSKCVWGQWTASCSNDLISIGKYPNPLPAGVAVPSWAYYDFTTAEYFNAATASQVSGLESTAVSSATATSTLKPTPEPPVTTQSQSNSNNTGAIIGGVVGGVLGIAFICLVVFILVRKRKPEDPTANYPEAGKEPHESAQTNLVTPVVEHVPQYQFSVPNQPVSAPAYNPYGPSGSATPQSAPVTPDTGHHTEPLSYSYRPQGSPGLSSHPTAP
ncbi:unnamed protein product [Rhizoctonia solani]|uniref:Transmembrane protein n=1 Tax=Rhizoctonia solani TaxID=456999 RepID=A0A8H3H1X2_9AGAM|nr:unnamed protein product [Rhizoctonia solani]